MMSAHEAIPSSREFTLVGVTYGLYGLGLLLFWPTVIGLVIAYVKREDVPELLSSHYRWLIKTFWWWFVTSALLIGVMLFLIVPNALEIETAVQSRQFFNISWELIGAIVFGGFGLAIVWLWNVYRLIRGAVRLSDGRPAPGSTAS